MSGGHSIGSEARGGGLGQRPQPEVPDAQLLGEDVVALAALEREAQRVLVERPRGGNVADDRRHAGDELNLH